MKILLVLVIINLAIVTTFSQEDISRVQFSNDTILIGNKMIVKFTFNKVGEFIPPDLSNFEIIDGPFHKIIPPVENKYNELVNNFVYILKPTKLGKQLFDRAYLLSDNDTIKTNEFYFWVNSNPEGKIIKPKLDRIPEFGKSIFGNLFPSENQYLNKISSQENLSVSGYSEKETSILNDAEKQYILASKYHSGNGVVKDIKKAIRLYEKAGEKNHLQSQLNLGVLFLEGKYISKNYNKALYWFEKAAKNGNVDAQYNTGVLYNRGRGTQINIGKAIFWYKEAAKQDYISAMYNLGVLYETQNNIKDYKKSFYWFKKAAEAGKIDAQFQVGRLYYNGSGIKKSNKLALTWLKKAAKQNHIIAQSRLGTMYLLGEGTKKNVQKALIWLKKAANANDSSAQYNLGILYINGEDIKKDKKKALQWLRKAKKNGNPDAQKIIKQIERY